MNTIKTAISPEEIRYGKLSRSFPQGPLTNDNPVEAEKEIRDVLGKMQVNLDDTRRLVTKLERVREELYGPLNQETAKEPCPVFPSGAVGEMYRLNNDIASALRIAHETLSLIGRFV